MLKRILTQRTIVPVLGLLCLIAYLPALHNGFISDDYVILEWSDKFLANPSFLFSVPPQNFRMTSYLIFALLKHTIGYRPAEFYALNISLHFLVCVLAWRLALKFCDRQTAGMAAALFAVFQAPQEAVMWNAAMNETLCTAFILGTLLFWSKNKHLGGLVCYSLALISKESAPIVLLLIPLFQLWRKQKPFTRAYLLYLLPTAAFAVVFLKTWAANSMIRTNLYSVGPHAAVVLLKSLNQLLWPWLYIAIFLAFYGGRARLTASRAAAVVGIIAAPMLPYIFINYSDRLPSRQLYLASIVLMIVVASLVEHVSVPNLQAAFVVIFCIFNVGYIWIKKEKQFEDRAEPTTQLLRLLQTHRPTPIMIFGFAYYEPDIAKDVSWLVPGWTRDMIGLNGVGPPCTDCINLRWNPKTSRYDGDW